MRIQTCICLCGALAACSPSTGGSGSSGGSGAANGGLGGSGTGASTGVGGNGVGGSQGGSSAVGGASTGGTNAGGTSSGGTTGGFGGGGGDPAAGCDATRLLPISEDPAVRGPWAVGVRTVTIGRLTVEVLYPAQPGSTDGQPEVTYDVRDWLPPQERSKVPDANSPAVGPIGGNLFRDVPLDAEHGPYPVVVFVHGTASFRIASGSTNAHWASRGFVVFAADYPGLFLMDQLNQACLYPVTGAQDIPGDINLQLQALQGASGDLSFLAGHVDMTRLGLSGHSQGACVTATLTTIPNVRIVLPLSGSTNASAGSALQSLMFMGGIGDTVIGYNAPLIGNVVCPGNPLPATSSTGAYQASPGPPSVTKRLAGITGGGHLVATDLCQTNAVGRNAVQEAQADGVCGVNTAVIIGLPALFDCGTIDMAAGINAVNYVTTSALEETLHCKDRSAQFSSLQANMPQIGDFQHAP